MFQIDNHTSFNVYGEAYTLDWYQQLEDTIIPDPECTLEHVVAPIMVYSDGTKLTNFGFASLWPAYIWFASMLKYTLAKPNGMTAHHIAYFPSVHSLSKLK